MSTPEQEAYGRIRNTPEWCEPAVGGQGPAALTVDQWCFGVALLAAAASSGPSVRDGSWSQGDTETLAAEWAELIRAGGQR